MNFLIFVIIIGIFCLIYSATVGAKYEDFKVFPYNYEDLNISEKPIDEFSEYYYIGNSYFDLHKFPYTKIYFYKNFLVANYQGRAQVFEYNKAIMQIKNNFIGFRISILTDIGEVYIFVNKKRADLFKSLLNSR